MSHASSIINRKLDPEIFRKIDSYIETTYSIHIVNTIYLVIRQKGEIIIATIALF